MDDLSIKYKKLRIDINDMIEGVISHEVFKGLYGECLYDIIYTNFYLPYLVDSTKTSRASFDNVMKKHSRKLEMFCESFNNSSNDDDNQ